MGNVASFLKESFSKSTNTDITQPPETPSTFTLCTCNVNTDLCKNLPPRGHVCSCINGIKSTEIIHEVKCTNGKILYILVLFIRKDEKIVCKSSTHWCICNPYDYIRNQYYDTGTTHFTIVVDKNYKCTCHA